MFKPRMGFRQGRIPIPSPALVISIIALIAAIGGGYAIAKGGDKKSDKKISKKVSNKQITKRAPGLSVAHAKTADAFSHSFNKTGAAESVTTLTENDQWRVVGLCDPAGTLTVPGFDNGYNARNGNAIGIVDKSESSAFADTDDDDDADFNPGDGVAFNYDDFGDSGIAVAPDGRFVMVPAGQNMVIDSTSAGAPGFPGTGCTFVGFAVFG